MKQNSCKASEKNEFDNENCKLNFPVAIYC